ncbi:MAG: rhodanese-like domain-containing protein, partial [bacterium]|nr:rhodanese-like domain-containing protein [bacterium]
TWVAPAIVGGVFMGVGFLLGGYCPGTSICAMSIGKVDAMFFVGGGVLGVFLFGELYPLYNSFNDSTSLGAIKVFDSIGISQGLFAFLLIVMAVGAFFATTMIEKKINAASPAFTYPKRLHYAAGAFAVVLAVVLLVTPDRKTHFLSSVSDPGYVAAHPVVIMPIDELAFRIIDHEPNFRIIDVRQASEYNNLALPNSLNILTNDFFNKEWIQLFSQRHVRKVIVGNTVQEEQVAALLLQKLGFENIAILDGGLPNFQKTIFDPSQVQLTGSRWDHDVNRFHDQARLTITKMIADNKNKPVKAAKTEKKIKGGC